MNAFVDQVSQLQAAAAPQFGGPLLERRVDWLDPQEREVDRRPGRLHRFPLDQSLGSLIFVSFRGSADPRPLPHSRFAIYPTVILGSGLCLRAHARSVNGQANECLQGPAARADDPDLEKSSIGPSRCV